MLVETRYAQKIFYGLKNKEPTIDIYFSREKNKVQVIIVNV